MAPDPIGLLDMEAAVWLEPQDKGRGEGSEPDGRTSDAPAGESRPSDPGQIDALYRQEAPALRHYVRRVVRNSSDAEDIVQESFIRLWRALSCGNIQSPRAVLFKTGRNLALNHVRNDRVRNSDTARAAMDDAFARRIATAEEELIASEEAAACRHLMDGLPVRCRVAFVLRVVDELSYKEMSEQMQLSISTIEKHIGKGKNICRSRLADGMRNRDGSLEALLSGRFEQPQPGRTTRGAPVLLAAE
jgi:RNA polymerase sigma factor (sigma-70 family)